MNKPKHGSSFIVAALASPSMSAWFKETRDLTGIDLIGYEHQIHRATITGDIMISPEPEIEMNAVGGGKSVNPILLDRYKKGKQNRSGKKRRTSW